MWKLSLIFFLQRDTQLMLLESGISASATARSSQLTGGSSTTTAIGWEHRTTTYIQGASTTTKATISETTSRLIVVQKATILQSSTAIELHRLSGLTTKRSHFSSTFPF